MRVSLLRLLLVTSLLTACAPGSSSSEAPGSAPAASAPSLAVSPSAAAAPPASASPSAPDDGAQVVELAVRGGQVSGATGRVQVPVGTEVVLRVTSDVADELHLHGYDEKTDLTAGEAGELRFTADIPGTFEVELERAGTQLTRLQVR